MYWQKYVKVGYNPIEQKEVTTFRKRIEVNQALPMKEEYREFIASLLDIHYE